MNRARFGIIVVLIVSILFMTFMLNGFGQFWNTRTIEAKSTARVSNDSNFSVDPITKINVSRNIAGFQGFPQIIYRIKTPPIDDFDFVLALDTSGSIGYGNEKSQLAVMSDAIPKFMHNVISNYPNKNFRMSIMSWDDDIDFVTADLNIPDPFINTNPEKSKLMNLTDLYNLSLNYYLFDDKNNYFYSKEWEFTNLSLPIDASAKIFKNNPKIGHHRTSRFVILVTGRSEFYNCSDIILNSTENNTYGPIPIYVIGMDLANFECPMKDNLQKIAKYDEYKLKEIQTERAQFLLGPGAVSSDQLKKDLVDALDAAVDKAINEPAATDLTIVDTFYNYVDPKINSFEIKGKMIDDIFGLNKTVNIDGSNTISFGLAGGLLPDTETLIKFDAAIHLKGLPISITQQPISLFNGTIDRNTPRPVIQYRWFDGYSGFIDLKDSGVDVDIESPLS
jgi:hypothetical protein